MTTALFGITVLISSFLVFLVQPMVGRILLPTLGGTPSVWNTCVVFFQMTLLLGYGYAHLLSTRFRPRLQWSIHLTLLAIVCLALPFRTTGRQAPIDGMDPTLWLLGQLTLLVGLPFFVISSSAPLIQRWLAIASPRHSRDPYFLYAISNFGSLAALLSYPTLIEPHSGLTWQSVSWALGFLALALALTGCGWTMVRSLGRTRLACKPSLEPQTACHPETPPPQWQPGLTHRRRLLLVLLSAVPSSLMLGVTSYITTDVGSVPLVWVIPLSLYLISFIVAFSNRNAGLQRHLIHYGPYLLLLMPVLLVVDLGRLPWVVGGVHLICFFWVATVCHGELSRLRPDVDQLTEFYFLMSLGGVLGGAFNAFFAPLVFVDVWEYPLMLAAAAMLWPFAIRRYSQTDLFWAAGLLGFVIVGVLACDASFVETNRGALIFVAFAAPVAICFFCTLDRPVRFALCYGVVLFGTSWAIHGQNVIASRRGFFGVNKIVEDSVHGYRMMINGRTMHGMQRMGGDRDQPLSYYHRLGPMGDVFAVAQEFEPRRVAVIGLGSGTLASYARAGQTLDFYEIDPIVSELAQDPRYFTFLDDCQADWQIQLGDARVQLAQAFGGTDPSLSGLHNVSWRRQPRYDLMILDAFSSDSIPCHLLTREAFQLYLRGLDPAGAIAVHITNKHLDLKPLLAAVAAELDLRAVIRDDLVKGTPSQNDGRISAVYVLLTRNPRWVAGLLESGWSQLQSDRPVAVWTDDYINFLDVLCW